MKRALVLFVLAACRPDIVASAGGDGGEPSYCQGSGPPILVGDGITIGESDGHQDDVCTGTVAVRTFEKALCTCEDYVTSTRLVTDSFDGAVAPYAPGGTSGNVGVDGAVQTNDVVTVGGDLAIVGAAALGRDLDVTGAAAIGSDLGTGVTVSVGGDAQVGGNIDLAALDVGGTLTVPAGRTISAGSITTGATTRAPVTVDPPCACGDADLVDIAEFVKDNRDGNQDALIGLAPDRLTGYSGAVTLDLPCGTYYVGPVHGDGPLTIRATGRAVLLVDGDLAMTQPLTIELAGADAELDLMIGGLLTSNDVIVAGDPTHPSRTRLYVGGNGQILLSGGSQLAAEFYAPRAALELSGGATVFGSLFVRRLDQSAPVTIHYDVDVRRADTGC